MAYDDKVNKYVKWWTKDPQDKRSKVTLRHLLSFTSGFTDDSYNECFFGDFDTCTEKMYQNLTNSYDYREGPGRSFQYLSCHLQFAGAMAQAASGKGIQELFDEYLYKPFHMQSTSWEPKKNPSMAAGITTTGEDFENLLKGLLTYEVLPKTILDEMETDWTKPPVSPSGDGWFGHYGMGHWWECLGYGTPSERVEPLQPICMGQKIQAGPGEFGFYPLLDRSGGSIHHDDPAGPKRPAYYFNLALQEPDSLSGIPEYLRILAKPVVDVILAGENPDTWPRQSFLNQAGAMLREDIEYIGQSLGNCKCSKSKPLAKNEPYESLYANVPPVGHHRHGGVNRMVAEANGTGLLLRELIPIQQKLGTCKCKGRDDTREE
jgi:hypothetical protein